MARKEKRTKTKSNARTGVKDNKTASKVGRKFGFPRSRQFLRGTKQKGVVEEHRKEEEAEEMQIKENVEFGHEYFNREEYDRAIEYFQKAKTFAQKRANRKQEGYANLWLGHCHRFTAQYEYSIEYYKKAEQNAQESDDKKQEVYLGLGCVYMDIGRYQTATDYYERALKIAQKRGHKWEETEANLGLGDVYRKIKDQTAIECYVEAQRIAQENRDRRQEGRAYFGLAQAFIELNIDRDQLAIEYYHKAEEIARERGDKSQETEVYQGYGNAYVKIGKFENAIECYGRSKTLAQERQNHRQEAAACQGLGNAYKSLGQFQTAIKHYQNFLEIANERRDRMQEADAYVELGQTYRNIAEYKAAIEHYQKAREIAQEQNDQRQETKICLALGHAYFSYDQYQTAIKYYRQVQEIAQETADKWQEAEAYLGLGHAHRKTSQYQSAIEFFQKTQKVAKKQADRRQETEACLWLGCTHRNTKQYPKAIQYFQETLQISEEQSDKCLQAAAYFGLGHTHRYINEHQRAMEYYQKALENATIRGDKLQEAEACRWLGHIYSSIGQYQTSVVYYKKTLEIPREQDDKWQQAEVYFELAVAHNKLFVQESTELEHADRRSGEREAAIECYQKAREIAREQGEEWPNAETYFKLGISHKRKGGSLKPKNGSQRKKDESWFEENFLHPKFYYLKEEVCVKLEREELQILVAIYQYTEAKDGIDSQFGKFRGTVTKLPNNDDFAWKLLIMCKTLPEDVYMGEVCFPWLSGAYGVTGPTKKVHHEHIYITVKRGYTKSRVRSDIKNTFGEEILRFVELLQEPKKRPTIKPMTGKKKKKNGETGGRESLSPVPGGGISVDQKSSNRVVNPLQTPEQESFLQNCSGRSRASGTLTLFSSSENSHYALTCYHVGCDDDCIGYSSAFKHSPVEVFERYTLNAADGHHVMQNREFYYHFRDNEQTFTNTDRDGGKGQQVNDQSNNECCASFDKQGRVLLGKFFRGYFNEYCDIMSVKIRDDIELNCPVIDAKFSDNIRRELHERCRKRTAGERVIVEKIGYTSGKTTGYLVDFGCNVFYKGKRLFGDTYIIKGEDGAFLEEADSGALVFFSSSDGKKYGFGYGVYEIKDLRFPRALPLGGLGTDQKDNDTVFFRNDNEDNREHCVDAVESSSRESDSSSEWSFSVSISGGSTESSDGEEAEMDPSNDTVAAGEENSCFYIVTENNQTRSDDDCKNGSHGVSGSTWRGKQDESNNCSGGKHHGVSGNVYEDDEERDTLMGCVYICHDLNFALEKLGLSFPLCSG